MKNIILYTTEDCPYCNIAEKRLKDVLDEYDGLFGYESVKISKDMDSTIQSLPTILVGMEKIEGLPEKEQIHTALFA